MYVCFCFRTAKSTALAAVTSGKRRCREQASTGRSSPELRQRSRHSTRRDSRCRETTAASTAGPETPAETARVEEEVRAVCSGRGARAGGRVGRAVHLAAAVELRAPGDQVSAWIRYLLWRANAFLKARDVGFPRFASPQTCVFFSQNFRSVKGQKKNG